MSMAALKHAYECLNQDIPVWLPGTCRVKDMPKITGQRVIVRKCLSDAVRTELQSGASSTNLATLSIFRLEAA